MKRQAIYTTMADVNAFISEGQEWNFHSEVTKEPLHALHPYPAKFIPQIPRKAIGEFSKKGDVVLDPFCGCGTTLLEASRLGRSSVGVDNNAVAILVSKAKTAAYSKTHLRKLREFAETIDTQLARTKPRKELIPDSKNFDYWFSRDVLKRLSALKSLILEMPEPLQTLLRATFSSIIVRVSYQDSDTRYARIERVVRPEFVGMVFRSKLLGVIDSLPVTMVPNRAPVVIHQADTRTLPFIDDRTVSLIVTSPPYLNAYDYHKYHRQRLHWIDGSIEFARDLEIGKHDEFTKPGATPEKYFTDMDSCFSEWRRVLRRNGRCIVLIGDAIVSKKPVKVADTFIELLQNHGLSLEKRWIRELHSTKRSFNVLNSRMSHEHVLLLKRK